MVRAYLAAGALALVAAPVSAQIGLTSAPRSVSLLATRQSSVTVTLPADTAVRTQWNVDPAQPFAMTLRAFVDAPVRPPARVSGGAKAVAWPTGYATTAAPAVTVLFAQPIAGDNARAERQDALARRGASSGTLTLVVTTQ